MHYRYKLIAATCLFLNTTGCTRVDGNDRGSWVVVENRLAVEAEGLGSDAEFHIDLRNQSDSQFRIRVVNISCGCVTAMDDHVDLAPGTTDRMKFRVRPKVPLPTDETIRLMDNDGRFLREVVVTVAARTGVHISPASVNLYSVLTDEPRPVAEMLVAVPDSAGVPTVSWRFQPSGDASIEIVTDQPTLRRSGKGVAVFAVPVYLVGLRTCPRLVHECILEAKWTGGSGQASMLVTTAVKGP